MTVVLFPGNSQLSLLTSYQAAVRAEAGKNSMQKEKLCIRIRVAAQPQRNKSGNNIRQFHTLDQQRKTKTLLHTPDYSVYEAIPHCWMTEVHLETLVLFLGIFHLNLLTKSQVNLEAKPYT